MISNVLNLVDPKPPSAKRNINVITDIYHVNLDTSILIKTDTLQRKVKRLALLQIEF